MTTPHQPVTRIRARNFRSLADVDVRLAPLSVMIGPNGSGKTNLLNVLRFLATTVRFDLAVAVQEWRGFDHVQRQSDRPGRVEIEVEGIITEFASPTAPDSYRLRLTPSKRSGILRSEEFQFKRRGGRGRRITVSGTQVTITEEDRETFQRSLASNQTTGLATLPKLSDDEGGLGIRRFTEFLSELRVLEPDVTAAREPSRLYGSSLADDASNLADALDRLQRTSPDAMTALKSDVARCLPGFRDILLVPVGGSARSAAVQLMESGLNRPVDLADASFGTVRLIALLTALHEPEPPPFLAIEEIDHGLHPYALDILVDRLRAASKKTQILAATHSPTLVNRLDPTEIIVCDRNPITGESVIPAVPAERIAAAMNESEWRAGELWFAGALGGVPQ